MFFTTEKWSDGKPLYCWRENWPAATFIFKMPKGLRTSVQSVDRFVATNYEFIQRGCNSRRLFFHQHKNSLSVLKAHCRGISLSRSVATMEKTYAFDSGLSTVMRSKLECFKSIAFMRCYTQLALIFFSFCWNFEKTKLSFWVGKKLIWSSYRFCHYCLKEITVPTK